MSIPKIIHYCWFGPNPPGEVETKCLQSWKTFCPDYEIKKWDETNFNVHCNQYVEEAYLAKKYAFVSDYVRLYALKQFGGIYFDTDVELIKPIDFLLENKGFISLEVGSPTPHGRLILAATGLGVGCEPHAKLICSMLEEYNNLSMVTESGGLDLTTCAERGTVLLRKCGFDGQNRYQQVGDFVVLPSEYFAPLDFATGKLKITEKTLGIHLYSGSWKNKTAWYKFKKRLKCTRPGMLFMRMKYAVLRPARGNPHSAKQRHEQ